ncbi:MAG: hypothetical protein KJO36_03190, partial [Acidimicrobiia bacterium]|nr:hypothetical protein [Acidimicrobiia bacterium]
IKDRKQESVLARRAWPFLLVGALMIVVGMIVSQSAGGILVGLFNLAALVLFFSGIIGLVIGRRNA